MIILSKLTSTAGSNKATQTTSIAKIGLMYVHDYGFASDKNNWKTNLSGYNTDTNRQKNWLFNGVYEWTIPRGSDLSDTAFRVDKSGGVVDGYVSTLAFGVRPVFYLKSDTLFSGGDGTAKTPYKINLQ